MSHFGGFALSWLEGIECPYLERSGRRGIPSGSPLLMVWSGGDVGKVLDGRRLCLVKQVMEGEHGNHAVRRCPVLVTSYVGESGRFGEQQDCRRLTRQSTASSCSRCSSLDSRFLSLSLKARTSLTLVLRSPQTQITRTLVSYNIRVRRLPPCTRDRSPTVIPTWALYSAHVMTVTHSKGSERSVIVGSGTHSPPSALTLAEIL